MKFIYLGAGEETEDPMTVFRGLVFEKNGRPVEVLEEGAIAKLKKHPFFKVVSDDSLQGRPTYTRPAASGRASSRGNSKR